MNLSVDNVAFNAFIHTIQVGSAFEILPAEDVQRKSYIIKKPYYRDGCVHYVINPNKLFEHDYLISTLEECIEAISFIVDDLMLNESEWQIERLDIAIHTRTEYDSLYKINCYLKELYAQIIHCKNSFRVTGDQLQKRSTAVKTTKYELEIYNKHIQSGRNTLPMTRCEFRYKALRCQIAPPWKEVIYTCMSKTKEFLDSIPAYISSIDDVQTKFLIANFKKMLNDFNGSNSHKMDLYIAQYSTCIFTTKILKALYLSFCSGAFKDWLYRFKKKGNTLELINKSEIKSYCERMVSALRLFENVA